MIIQTPMAQILQMTVTEIKKNVHNFVLDVKRLTGIDAKVAQKDTS